MKLKPILYTERLILEPTSLEHAKHYFDMFKTENFIRYIKDHGYTEVNQAEAFIQDRFFTKKSYPLPHGYTIFTKNTNEFVGTCGLYTREGLNHFDIGYSMMPAFYRKGMAYEASLKVLNEGFNTHKAEMIVGITDTDNIPSMNLLKKLGLKYINDINLPGIEEKLSYFEMKKP